MPGMKGFLKKGWIPLILILLVAGVYIMSAYNNFVSQDESVKKYYAELQATYQRRLDLLPNLVNVVKANSEYEKTVLQQVAEARAIALQTTGQALPANGDLSALENSQNEVANAANRLIAVIEAYPDIKATEAFTKLQTQLEGTERRIKVARNDLNAAIKDYNEKVRSVPANMVAGLFGFKSKEGFQADPGAAQPPEIKF
jgi:LemA protein